MIDWNISDVVEATVKYRDMVYVSCEKCGKKRNTTYEVAKRKTTHVCMSCVKRKGDFSPKDIVIYVCIDCGAQRKQLYRHKAYYNWRCNSCGVKASFKSGTRQKSKNKRVISEQQKLLISQRAKASWDDPEYVAKWKATRFSKKEEHSKFNKELWSDPERLFKLSESIKQKWKNQKYRDVKSQQSAELWLDIDYRNKQKSNLSRKMKELWDNPEFRVMMYMKHAWTPGRISQPQALLYRLLDDIKIKYYKEGPETHIVKYFRPFDCIVPSNDLTKRKHLIIEVQSWFHLAAYRQRTDKSKFTTINRYYPDYEIMYIWSCDFASKDQVLNKLCNKLDMQLKLIDFEFKNVKIVSDVKADEYKPFLAAYHYIGKGRGGNVFGAYLNDKLIACAIFSPPIRQNIAQQFHIQSLDMKELSRFCIHPCYQKKNFASWFLARIIKLIDTKLIIAYSDTTVGHVGTIYKASNFKHHHTVPADYWYENSDGFKMHKKTLYNQAIDLHLKESEFADKFGYNKIYGGEKLCYVLEMCDSGGDK